MILLGKPFCSCNYVIGWPENQLECLLRLLIFKPIHRALWTPMTLQLILCVKAYTLSINEGTNSSKLSKMCRNPIEALPTLFVERRSRWTFDSLNSSETKFWWCRWTSSALFHSVFFIVNLIDFYFKIKATHS